MSIVRLKLIKPIGYEWPAIIFCESGIQGIAGFIDREDDGTYSILDPSDYLPQNPPLFINPEEALLWVEEHMLKVTGHNLIEIPEIKEDRVSADDYGLTEATIEIMERWGSELWLLDVDISKDDAGERVQLTVDTDMYPSYDPVPRIMRGPLGQKVYIIVRKIHKKFNPYDFKVNDGRTS